MRRFEDILAGCIDDLKQGRANIEDCLDRYPSLRERLEPLLRLALQIGEPAHTSPSLDFKLKARVRLMEEIHERQGITRWPWLRYRGARKQMVLRRRFSMVGIIVAIVLTVTAAGGGTAYASQASLPGDTLYPVKLATEEVRMGLPGDEIAKAERALTFAERRVAEMEALTARGRTEDLALAVERYDEAIDRVTARIERANDRGLATGNVTARVAEATARHLSVLDRVYDRVPDQAKPAIAHAREVSQRGHENALGALARSNGMRAAEINRRAMWARLDRARTMAEGEDAEGALAAVEQFERMADLGEEISRIAWESPNDAGDVEEFIADAVPNHMEVLAQVWQMVPEQARPAIERAMTEAVVRHQERSQALERRGVRAAPIRPIAPMPLWERVEERVRERGARMPEGTFPGEDMPILPGGSGVYVGPPGCRGCRP